VIRRRVTIAGTVQGVFFRDTTRRLAAENAVAGWVRNDPDGTVEAVFEGEADAVERMLAFARNGPEGAHVETTTVEPQEPEGLQGFRIT
jgi:acylphosphatase